MSKEVGNGTRHDIERDLAIPECRKNPNGAIYGLTQCNSNDWGAQKNLLEMASTTKNRKEKERESIWDVQQSWMLRLFHLSQKH